MSYKKVKLRRNRLSPETVEDTMIIYENENFNDDNDEATCSESDSDSQ